MIDSNNTLTIDTDTKNNYYDINNDNNENSGDDNNLFGVSYYYNNIMNKRIQFYYRESIIDRSFVKYHVDVNDHDRVSNETTKLLVSSSASQSPLIASPSILENPDISDSTNIGFLTSSSEATAAIAAAKPTSQSSVVPISSSLSLSSSTTTASSTYVPLSLLPIKTEMYLSSPQVLSASSQSLSQQQQQQQQQPQQQQASIPQVFDKINHDAQDNKNNTIVEPKSIENYVSCTTNIDANDQTKTVDIINNGTGFVESSVSDDINDNNNRTSINYNDNDDGGIVSSNGTMSKTENDKSNNVILNDSTDNKNIFDFSTDNNDNQEINILSQPRSQHLIDDIMYDADNDNEDEDIFNRIIDDADDAYDNDDSTSYKNSIIHSMDRKFDRRMIKNSYQITGNNDADDNDNTNKDKNNAHQMTELTAETQPQLLQIQPSSSIKLSSSSPMLSRSFSLQQPEQEQLNSNLLVFNQYKLRNKSINIETIFEEFNNDHIDYDYSEHLKKVSLKNSAILLGWKVMMLWWCLTIIIMTT